MWMWIVLAALALLISFDIVVGMRKDDMGHRVPLRKRLRLWTRRMFDLWISS